MTPQQQHAISTRKMKNHEDIGYKKALFQMNEKGLYLV
jgi:hypothetical protein